MAISVKFNALPDKCCQRLKLAFGQQAPSARNPAQWLQYCVPEGQGGKAAAVGQMNVDLKSANYLKINCRNSFQTSAECACVRKCVCAHKIKYVNLNLTFEWISFCASRQPSKPPCIILQTSRFLSFSLPFFLSFSFLREGGHHRWE